MLTTYLILCAAAFVAGFIDSIAGGGGLIQVPALLIMLPQVPIPMLFGTNKLASICGTFVAARRYQKEVSLPIKTVGWGTLTAFLCSFFGAWNVSRLPPELLRPLIFVLMIMVLIYTVRKPALGQITGLAARIERPVAAAVFGGVLGFYDGIFGPGTGSFLMFGFIYFFGFNFLEASAATKVVNLATNLGALILFALHGSIMLGLGCGMAIANMAGASVGSRLAVLKGSPFVRKLFIAMASLLVLRLGYDIFFVK